MCEARVRVNDCRLLWRDVGVQTAAFGREWQLGGGVLVLMLMLMLVFWVLLDGRLDDFVVLRGQEHFCVFCFRIGRWGFFDIFLWARRPEDMCQG